MQQLSIGAVAELTQIPAHTLRKWKTRHGIAVPLRSDTGRRIYTHEHVEQLRLIRALVDRGHALSHLASLDIDALRELGSLHQEPAAKPSVSRLALVGPNACWLLSGSGLVVQRHTGDLTGWASQSLSDDVDALVIECDTLPAATMAQLHAMQQSLKLCIVIYRYASRRALAELADLHIVAVRGPATDQDILNHLHSAPAEHARIPRSAPRFDNAELGRIAALSPGLQCECPNHIAKLLMDITSFEHYSRECEDTDPAERALHEKLGNISAQARALFEDALVAVATADGIALKPSV